MIDFLIWIDRRVFGCHWHWYCALVWDWQMARDAKAGRLDFLMPTQEELGEFKAWDEDDW